MARFIIMALWLALLGSLACESEDSRPDAAVAADVSPGDGATDPMDARPSDADAGVTDAAPADASPMDANAPLGPVVVDISNPQPPPLLSDFRFFRLRNGVPDYNQGVVPYDLNTPLFSDFALKWRAIYLPPGSQIQFHPTDSFEFPVGSAIVKSFAIAPDLRTPEVDVRILETRVLIRYADGWRAFPYLWREDRSDADFFARGAVLPLTFIDPRGQTRTAQYLVPQRNQCFACHDQLNAQGGAFLTPLGPKARYLHRSFPYEGGAANQLTHLAGLGWLEGLPDLGDVNPAFDFSEVATTGTTGLDQLGLERAARDYLDINCAHCHNPNSVQGVTSQLFLSFDTTDRFRLGVCKEPGSAGTGSGGLRFDIVPGNAAQSILHFRMASETVGEIMPLVGRSLRDDPAVELIRAWIDGMAPEACD